MQSVILKLFQIWFKTVETVVPKIAQKWAVDLFFTPMRFKRPAREEGFMQKAKVTKVPLQIDRSELYDLEWAKNKVLNKQFNNEQDKSYYIRYELGEGPIVLLVHGWSGRGSQMGSIANVFVEKGYKVITFDGFAHGDSPGKQTTIPEFVEIIKDIYKRFGLFEVIVGHSLGGIAAGKAIIEGVESKKLVTIASPTTINYILEAFCKIINASQATLDYINIFIERYTRSNGSDFSLVNIAQKLNIPGLIVHDKNDREADYNQALFLEEMWPDGKLVSTSGLGHTRILRDEKIIKKIVEFTSVKKNITAEMLF